MSKIKTAVTVTILLTLCACQTTGTQELADAGIDAGVSATDCFAAGGTIETADEKSMCKMKDGSFKPIL